jgi:hypothetical protein
MMMIEGEFGIIHIIGILLLSITFMVGYIWMMVRGVKHE